MDVLEEFGGVTTFKDLLTELCDTVVENLDNLNIGKTIRISICWPTNSTQKYVSLKQLSTFLLSRECLAKNLLSQLPQREMHDDEKEYIDRADNSIESDLIVKYEDVVDALEKEQPWLVNAFKLAVIEVKAAEKVESPTKMDAKRLNEIRKKTIQNTSDWNIEMNRNKRYERASFFEHQTMQIHYPKTSSTSLTTNTNFGVYPVAVVPGQYQNYYKKYTTKQLYRLPVNTVLDGEVYKPLKRCASPEPIVVTQTDLQKTEDKNVKENSRSVRRNSKSSLSLITTDRASVDTKAELNENCAFCCEEIKIDDKYVQCSKCRSCGHPQCMEMPDSMLAVVESYPWMCMECKPCSICSKLDSEEKMLFCDRCDRGYHTFCVGLDELPSGCWECPKFCRQDKAAPTTTAPLNFSCLSPASATLALPSDEKSSPKKRLGSSVGDETTPSRKRR